MLEFEYVSHGYPDSLTEDYEQLCSLTIDHNWRFSNQTLEDERAEYEALCSGLTSEGASPTEGNPLKKPDICQVSIFQKSIRGILIMYIHDEVMLLLAAC